MILLIDELLERRICENVTKKAPYLC